MKKILKGLKQAVEHVKGNAKLARVTTVNTKGIIATTTLDKDNQPHTVYKFPKKN